MSEKACLRCGVVKPLTDFYPEKGGRDGHRGDCKACVLAAAKDRHKRNPEPTRERARRWNQANRERYQARMQAYKDSGKKQISDRKSHLKRKYGLTVEDYE